MAAHEMRNEVPLTLTLSREGRGDSIEFNFVYPLPSEGEEGACRVSGRKEREVA